eukprot:m.221058 g.221058  ORF g.221058 m.221058 type:complete len:428 (+) comp15706_c0_seq1:60-1343(+)
MKPTTGLPFVPSSGIGHEAVRRAVQKVVDKDATHGEPFFIIDLGSVYRKHKQWQRMLPRVQPFYAMKCCNEPKILEALASLGTGFDCASRAEIEMVLKMGVEPSRIIFAHPAKSISHIKYAREVGVDLMTFDNEIELTKIKEHHPTARMVLRILADDPHATCQLGVKFGAAPSDALAILQSAKAMGIDVVGVSFHVGSGCSNAEAFHDAVASARRVFNDAATVGYDMTLLDIGGGFPGHDSSRISFKDITNVLNDAFERYFPEDCGVKLMAEPGRYYVAASGTLALNVVAKRVVKHQSAEGEENSTMYYLNDGVYGALNCIMYDHQTPVPVLLRAAPDAPTQRCSVWGPTCDGLDCIAKSCELPEAQIGDWVIFEDAGAYTLAAGSCFNGFQRPAHIYTFSASEHFDDAELPEGYPVTPRIQTMVNV